ncbi:MAG: LON peptidase substrate-binding domain-containing protein, partial [Pseudomonadales bacterium]
MPLLPLRDMVVYPHGVHPLFVGTESSIRALESAMAENKQILLLAKRDADREVTGTSDLYSVGTVATILQLLKLPDGTVKVLVEGAWRARVHAVAEGPLHFVADVDQMKEPANEDRESRALAESILEQFEQFVKSTKKVPQEVMASLGGIDDPGRLVDTIAAQMSLSLADRQRILEAAELPARIEVLLGLIDAEIDFFELEKRIRGRVKKQMEKSQREYYLNEQIKAIQKELGDLDESPGEVEELERRIESGGLTAEARKRAQTELSKLKQMSPMSAEATVVRTYLDWLINVPWKARSKVRRDLIAAQRILDEDHYGLEEVKERILEYLAVQTRVSKMKGPVLCLVGPPGVGKTSLGESIARATNRKFVRMALGGVRDEAEIRGHRRTYIGALPGKVVQKMSKVGVRNP